ncbi:hypothetical protein BCR23_00035 [Enterococcus quebecensis]|uniref:Uncharacterized protein n=1 Tax=Enterococcus quebecensis TaxID=903983 RepID=A0A1E5H299_9ENTE|nr:hypothetical protein BCR23_00035 [Enterococcus quebecensis]
MTQKKSFKWLDNEKKSSADNILIVELFLIITLVYLSTKRLISKKKSLTLLITNDIISLYTVHQNYINRKYLYNDWVAEKHFLRNFLFVYQKRSWRKK